MAAPLLVLLLCSVPGLVLLDARGDAEDHGELKNAILEMLHINKVSASRQAKAHPYMKQIYQSRASGHGQDVRGSDGTLVQSFQSLPGPDYAPPGWIWFNVSSRKPLMMGAELVLFRKTLHPVSVTVTVHGVGAAGGVLEQSPTLQERLLHLDHRTPAGYDVFDVSAILGAGSPEALGFQLRYTDDRGSLVLHEALTRSLYCLNPGSPTQPLLVLYQTIPNPM